MGRHTPSFEIGHKASQTHYYARGLATTLGLPLTHVVTINYASTSIDPRKAVASFSRLRTNYFNKWAAVRSSKTKAVAFTPTYVFAFENVRDKVPFMTMEEGEPHNVHVHWELHLPATRVHDFENNIWSWVEATAGQITGGAETIRVQTAMGTKNYCLKGASSASTSIYGRGQTAEAQGLIIGRRADTSRNLGPTARRRMDRKLNIHRRLPSKARPTFVPGASA